jgi:uncharacterized protein
MLELKPTCEHCNKPLPPTSTEAQICTFECTFCASCVAEVIKNVCPNCGGNLCPRPVRPARELMAYPASTVVTHRPVNLAAHRELIERLGTLAPEEPLAG